MVPDRRAPTIAAFALVGLCAVTSAHAQNAPTWGLPGNLRGGPYAAMNRMVPPDASTALPRLGEASGTGSPDPTILIENRGTVELSFVVAGPNGVCGRHTVRPNDIVPAKRCGSRLAWHDGRETKEIQTRAGGVYQFFWNGDRWGLADVTADRFE